MRIGMLADAYKPHVSGITTYIALNKRYLERVGHEVYVFTFGDDKDQDDELNVIRTRGLPLIDSGIYFNLRYSPKGQRLLRSMDVAHVHHPFFSGWLATRYCQPAGIPIIFTSHTRYDIYAQVYLPIIPDVVGEAFLKTYLPSFCKACNLVIAPSPGIRDVLKVFGVESKVEVIPNGVDLSPFQAPVEPIPRPELGFKVEDVVLTYMGRIGPEKNLSFLVRAFAGAAKAYDNIGLLFLGDGPERDNLEDQVRHLEISDRVRFAGMVPYHLLPRYLSSADAFVTASVSEVHPLSVIESMAAGLPVLGIQSPGVGDIVEDGKTGLLAPDQDLAVFTAKMVRLATDYDLRKRLASQAKSAAEAYSIDRTAQIVLEHYERLVGEATGRKRGFRYRVGRFVERIRP